MNAVAAIEWDPRLPVGEGNERLDLQLHPYPFANHPGPRPRPTARKTPRHAVLLLHGGNTSRDTFLYPNGGLSRYLTERGYDVWLLDWRGSPYVVDELIDGGRPCLGGTADAERRLFTLDAAAEVDLPAALAKIRSVCPDGELSIVGHCLGAGATAIANARGLLEPFGVQKMVLSTMGLFYEVPWNGWIKAEDFLLERVLSEEGAPRGISPTRTPWPDVLESAYEKWPAPWLPSQGDALSEMLRRLAFMFGQPYSLTRFHPSLRNDILLDFFGHLHLGLYLHVSQLVRRGYAARFDVPDVIDRPRLGRFRNDVAGVPAESDLIPRHFRGKRLTLISAGENHLWHREAIDLMYDWLKNVGCRQARKHVFADYNIQELMWGERAEADVYPKIEAGLA